MGDMFTFGESTLSKKWKVRRCSGFAFVFFFKRAYEDLVYAKIEKEFETERQRDRGRDR